MTAALIGALLVQTILSAAVLHDRTKDSAAMCALVAVVFGFGGAIAGKLIAWVFS